MCKQFATFLIAALACGTLSAQELSPTRLHQPTLTAQNSGTANGLIAVWPVNPRVVWACGRAGTFTVTTDGGQTWRAGVVPGAEALQFRDVQAFSANVAYLMSIGTSGDPTEFRIYKYRGRRRDLDDSVREPERKCFLRRLCLLDPAPGNCTQRLGEWSVP